MLQTASSAEAKVRTARFYPNGCWLQDLYRNPLIETPVSSGIAESDTLSGKGAIDKGCLAANMRDPPPFVGDRLYPHLTTGTWRHASDLFRISTCFSQCLGQSAQGFVGGLGYLTLGLSLRGAFSRLLPGQDFII